MTNPTSNYGFVLPTATDLVTDLPADFEVALQGVDTRLKALQPGTTLGDIAYSSATANTNTRLGIGTTGQVLSVVAGVPAWVTGTTGDIEGVTVTSPITGGGTSGTVNVGIQSASTTQTGAVQLSDSTATTSSVLAATPTAVKSAYDLAAAAIPKSTVTTAGDMIYATGSSAVTRRAIGSTGDVLTVAGGVPTWAAPAAPSSMISLASGSYTGTALNITGLSTSYNTLIMQLSAFDPSGGSIRLRARFNADTGNKYLNLSSTSASASNFNIGYLEVLTPDAHSTDARAAIYIQMYNYATSNAYKQGLSQAIVTNPANTADVNTNLTSCYYNSTTAISQVNFFDSAGGTFSLTYTIWGVK